MSVIQDAQSRNDENEPATDNAVRWTTAFLSFLVLLTSCSHWPAQVSALGKVCLHHAVGDMATVLPVWLAYLPLKSDMEEAVIVNEQLCQFLERYACASTDPRQLGIGCTLSPVPSNLQGYGFSARAK